MLYGYARVSTIDQDLSIQLDALTAAGCTVIRSEKVTGTSTEGREELATLLEFLREGDTLVVTRIDRPRPVPPRPAEHRPRSPTTR
jgi:DNA invertase Pin-like site-specific DNA recombinase